MSGLAKYTVELRKTAWTETTYLAEQGNLQAATDSFYKTINEAQDLCQPLKVAKFKGDQPWMTAEIKSIVKRRQKFHKQGRHDEWKLAANEFRCVTRAAKKRHYQKFVHGNFKAWDEINKVRNPKREEVADQELANKQNEAFRNVWNDQKQPDISNYITINPSTPWPNIFSESIVEQAIKKQKSGSPGPDGLLPTLLKSARLELSSTIAFLFNLFIRFSFVPSQWKSANITPIPKVDNLKAL